MRTRIVTFWRRHYAAVVALLMVTVFVVVSLEQAAQTRQVNRDSYHRCTDRNINVGRANRFYQAMARLEASNPFIDATLRSERVALYSAQVFSPADCGAKP